MAFDIFLCIICIVFTGLCLAAGFYMVIRFQHPEDKWNSWFPKIVVTLALGVASMNVLLLPLDAINRSSGNTLRIDIMCWVFTIASLVLAFIVCPFAMFYYENKDEEEELGKKKHPVCKALLELIPFILFLVILFLILWFAVGRCEIPIEVHTTTTSTDPNSLDGACTNCMQASKNWTITPSAITYFVSLLGFIGYLFLIILGGFGVITLPFGLIENFVYRPRPISLQVYSKAKLSVNRWANDLLEEGQALREDVLALGRNHKSVRTRYTKFEQQVEALEETYKQVEIAYRFRGGNPIWPWVSLFLGIIAIIFSIVWVIHIIIYYICDVHPFLNVFFNALDNAFPYAAVVFFGLFVYYLYWCVIDGTTSIGLNIFIMRIHPMEVQNTPMTSLLFNSIVILFASFGVALFSCMNFSVYTRLSSLDMIYGIQTQTLIGIKYVWQYGVYVFFAFILFGLIYKACKARKPTPRVKMLKQFFTAYDMSGINEATGISK